MNSLSVLWLGFSIIIAACIAEFGILFLPDSLEYRLCLHRAVEGGELPSAAAGLADAACVRITGFQPSEPEQVSPKEPAQSSFEKRYPESEFEAVTRALDEMEKEEELRSQKIAAKEREAAKERARREAERKRVDRLDEEGKRLESLMLMYEKAGLLQRWCALNHGVIFQEPNYIQQEMQERCNETREAKTDGSG